MILLDVCKFIMYSKLISLMWIRHRKYRLVTYLAAVRVFLNRINAQTVTLLHITNRHKLTLLLSVSKLNETECFNT